MTLPGPHTTFPDVAPAEDGLSGGRATPFSSPFPPPPPPTPQGPPPPARRRGSLVVGTAALCAVLSAGVAYGTVQLTEDDGSVSVIATGGGAAGATLGADADIYDLLEAVEPAVTAIELGVRENGSVSPVAAGSGVIISTDGLMLTNAHVVEATDSLGQPVADPVYTVKMYDGTVRAATVLGASADYDIALMQLEDASNLTALPLADATTFRVGDGVVAIGNALDLGDAPTVSTGIISALDRSLTVDSGVTLRGLIQTDAAINHGNSGGALVNARGELVGINSAGIPDAQNIGFAISVGTIQPLLEDLKAGREVTAAKIGYIGVNLSQTPDGIVIVAVQPDTPASAAGLQEGDIITQVNDTVVSTTEQLSSVLQSLAPGTKVTITVSRDGASSTFDLTLAERPVD